MICALFKWQGYRGIAVAENMQNLFWQIDQHGDPYQAKVYFVTHGSICGDTLGKYSELSEEFFNKKWSTIDWDIYQPYAKGN